MLATLMLLIACGPAQPCLDQCEDDNDFFQACMDEDGLLCDGQLAVDCADDAEAVVDCYQALEEGGDCDVEQLMADGALHYCESPQDLLTSCKAMVRERFAQEDKEEQEERRQQCLGEPSSEFDLAISEQDCQALCDIFGLTVSLDPSYEPGVFIGRHRVARLPLD